MLKGNGSPTRVLRRYQKITSVNKPLTLMFISKKTTVMQPVTCFVVIRVNKRNKTNIKRISGRWRVLKDFMLNYV